MNSYFDMDNIITEVGYLILGGTLALIPVLLLGWASKGDES